MTTSPQFHVYHCPDAPVPWVAIIWAVGIGAKGKPRLEPLPMMFHAKTEMAAGDAAEEWWRSAREKEASPVKQKGIEPEGLKKAREARKSVNAV